MNLDNETLKICSLYPLTGYNRDGLCNTDENDKGKHLVCAKMDKGFLEYTNSKHSNNLDSVVKEGDNWCICEDIFMDSIKDNKNPLLIREATNSKIKHTLKNMIGGGKPINKLPRLKPDNQKNKKYIYKLNLSNKLRHLALDEKINYEHKQTKKTLKKAATSKKGRLNILRIYRRYKNPKECNIITSDMKYIDRKYKLGKTNNICNKTRKGGKKSTKKTRRQTKQFLFNPTNPKKSFDVYIDKDPSDTISIKYTTLDDVEKTINKLERLYKTKKYSHKRIWQVGMIMKVRLEVIYKKNKKLSDIKKRYELAENYFKFLKKRSSKKTFNERKKMIFSYL